MQKNCSYWLRHVVLVVALLLVSLDVFAYICDKDAIGPLSVTIEKIEKVTALNQPRAVKVVFKNDSDKAVELAISAQSIEQVTVTNKDKTLTVPAKGTAETTVQFQCGTGTYNAHYPIHVFAEFEWEGAKHVLHPVQVFETDFGAAGLSKKPVGKSPSGREIFTGELFEDATQLPLLIVPNAGGVALTETDAYRVTWQRDGLQASGFGKRLQTPGFRGRLLVPTPKPEARIPKPCSPSAGRVTTSDRARIFPKRR